MKLKKAVCLLSGGLDSATTCYIAKNKGYQIYALSFLYGQKHKKEVKCAKKIASKVDAFEHVFFEIDLSKFKGSSLTDSKKKIPIDQELDDIGKKIPSTYVPARNTVFLSIALAYAETINADAIFIGVTATDYSGYPDCRPEYIRSYQKMADLATKKAIEGKPVEIITPLLFLSKSEIIRKGLKLGVPYEDTWSCYKGEKEACGRCDSCKLRLKGFMKNNLDDPIKYSSYPKGYKKK